MTAPDIPEDIRARAVRLYWTAVHSDVRLDGVNAIIEALLSERTRATEAAFEEAAKIAEDNNFWPKEGEEIAAEIRASIRTEGTAKCEAAKVRYAPAIGTTLSEMRASIPAELYNLGDAKLVWANEGDLAIAASIRTEGTAK